MSSTNTNNTNVKFSTMEELLAEVEKKQYPEQTQTSESSFQSTIKGFFNKFEQTVSSSKNTIVDVSQKIGGGMKKELETLSNHKSLLPETKDVLQRISNITSTQEAERSTVLDRISSVSGSQEIEFNKKKSNSNSSSSTSGVGSNEITIGKKGTTNSSSTAGVGSNEIEIGKKKGNSSTSTPGAGSQEFTFGSRKPKP